MAFFENEIFLLELRKKQREWQNDFEEPAREFRCEYCDLRPTYDYDETYLCTLHFHQLKQKFNEQAKKYPIELPIARRIIKTLQKDNGELVHYFIKEL